MTDPDYDVRSVLARVPHLRTLLGAEFNQDWTLDWASVEEVLQTRIDRADGARRSALLHEIDVLLNSLPADRDIETFLEYVGSGLVSGVDVDESPRAWLAKVRDRLQCGRPMSGDVDGLGLTGHSREARGG
jgi:hypothetical protein